MGPWAEPRPVAFVLAGKAEVLKAWKGFFNAFPDYRDDWSQVTLSVRYGKAMAGGPPRRRNVLTVFDWAVEVIEQYLEEIRPLYRRDEHPAL